MKGILVYQPPDKPAQLPEFIDGLDPRLREKIIMQLYQLSKPHKPELREPHFKRFSLERYRDLCELRVKSKMLFASSSTFAPTDRCCSCMASSKDIPFSIGSKFVLRSLAERSVRCLCHNVFCHSLLALES